MSQRSIAVAAGTLCAALLLFWVGSCGVNVPIAGVWDHVTTSVHWHDQGVDAASLLRWHNEHCLAIPRLVNHAVLKASGGNYRGLLFVNAGIAIAMLAVVLAFAQRFRLSQASFAAVAVAVAMLVTSWCQWQNWIWAFQTPWFLLPLLLVAAAVAIVQARSAWAAVAVACVAATVAPFCMANGIFVGWSLLLPLLLRLAEEPRERVWRPVAVAIISILAVTAVGLWLVVKSRGPSTGGFAAVLSSPLEAIRLGLAVLGSPLDPRGAFHGRKTLSTIAGAASLAVGLVATGAGLRAGRTPVTKELGPGFALMAYGLASVGAVVAGRLSMLAADPVESRYHTFAIAWHVGTLLSCTWLAAKQSGGAERTWRIVLLAAAAACIMATVSGMSLFHRHGVNMRESLEGHQATYRNALEPGGREKLEAVSGHYGAEGILQRLDGMARARILHPDYTPIARKD